MNPIILALILTLGLAQGADQVDQTNEPVWIKDPSLGGKHPWSAVGTAKVDDRDLGLIFKEAGDQARAKIAGKFNLGILKVFKSWGASGGMDIGENAMVNASLLYQEVLKPIIKNEIQQSPAREYHVRFEEERLFVVVMLRNDGLKQIRVSIKSGVRSGLSSHFTSAAAVEQAFRTFDALIDREFATSD